MFNFFKSSKSEIALALNEFNAAFRTLGIFSAVINVMLLVPSLYMLQVYDRVLTSRNETTLLMLTIMVLGAFLCMSALEFVRSFVLIRVGAQLDMKLNKRIYTAAFEANLKKAGGNAGQALTRFLDTLLFAPNRDSTWCQKFSGYYSSIVVIIYH